MQKFSLQQTVEESLLTKSREYKHNVQGEKKVRRIHDNRRNRTKKQTRRGRQRIQMQHDIAAWLRRTTAAMFVGAYTSEKS